MPQARVNRPTRFRAIAPTLRGCAGRCPPMGASRLGAARRRSDHAVKHHDVDSVPRADIALVVVQDDESVRLCH